MTTHGSPLRTPDVPDLESLLALVPIETRSRIRCLPVGSQVELTDLSPGGQPGRCRVRVLDIVSGRERGRKAAFFYKPSAVPFSRDRYSYGGAIIDHRMDAARLTGWLDYLASHFDPERTPADVRRALTFELPDFEPVGAGAPASAVGGTNSAPVAGTAMEGAVTNGAAPAGAGQGSPGSVEVTRPGSRDSGPSGRRELNPGELEVDLFCRGIRIDPSCRLEEDARLFSRTRAGLGSGLELVIPGPLKDLWLNVPVEEDFARDSPYSLVRAGNGAYRVVDARLPDVDAADGRLAYAVRIPPEPAWYSKKTQKGTLMSRVGVLQGTYLGIYISNSCGFWYHKPEAGCRFCTTGLNVGVNEVAEKEIEDVVEVARAAREESGNTFVHFNSGFHGGDRNLEAVAPYVKAVKERVGALIGVQVVPSPNLWKYDWMIDLGANHFSFCYEFENPEYFARLLPGKERLCGQQAFFDAMEYCVKKLGKGSCSGEIIAGVEPIEDTLKAIDRITGIGAFPTVCIFRPTIGSAMERYPSPDPREMMDVMRYMYEACRKRGIPIGMAPNIEVSLIVNPDDARYLAPRTLGNTLYEKSLDAMRWAARPMFRREMTPRPIRADALSPETWRRGQSKRSDSTSEPG